MSDDVFGKALDWGTKDGAPPIGAHCCRALTLFWTFNDLAASYEAARRGEKQFKRPDTGQLVDNISDIETIGPMLRLVGVCNANPLEPTGKFDEPRKVWRCIHAREDNGFRCAIYDKRPKMCRTYPVNVLGSVCQYHSCQSTFCPDHPVNAKEESDAPQQELQPRSAQS
jgi:Fe-S-cluster containining protein